MKRTAGIVFVMVVLSVFCMPLGAYAEDNGSGTEFYSQIDDVLGEFDVELDTEEVGDVTFGGLAEKAVKMADISGKGVLTLLGTVIVMTVLSAALKAAGGGIIKESADVYSSVCAVTAAAVISPAMFTTFSRTMETLRQSGGFIAAFIPVFSGITAVSGGIAQAGIYDAAVLAASELILQLSGGLLMPMLSASAVLSITGSVFRTVDLACIVQLIKRIVNWFISVSMLLFTGFVTMKCSLAGKADGAASKTVRYMISGFVPLVGGAVNDAYATVRSSFDVIRGTIGTAGCLAVILIMLPPVLQIMVFRLVMWTGAAAAELLGEEIVAKLLRSVDGVFSVAQSVLVCYGVMFILCTAILMRNMG